MREGDSGDGDADDDYVYSDECDSVTKYITRGLAVVESGMVKYVHVLL